ncbi:MAG: LptF/LptG family permease [Synergistaceae bacterium]|nr:LptF/LptG family permease [Synergistaceae bacterium]MBR1657484.1 LptF/LptG family permease [Synergistaceae bacterium]
MRRGLLNKLILGACAGPFFFGILIFVLIFVAGDLLFQAARLIIEQGVSLGIVTRLFFYRLPEVVVMTIPMSSLLSTLLGMSTLNAGSELIALKSLGIPFTRIARPVIIASVLISLAGFGLNETVVPFGAEAADKLMKYEIMKHQASAVQQKVFLKDEQDGKLKRVLYIDELDPEKGVLSGIMMHEFDVNGSLSHTLNARRGMWQDSQWWVEDGRMYDVDAEGEIRLLLRFERQRLALRLSPEQLQRSTRRPADMSAHELWSYIKQGEGISSELSELWVMFHLKTAIPWACVIMAVLGAGFGASRRGRSGGGVGFGISVVIVFAYYVVMSLCRALGEAGNIPPFIAGWGPNIVFFFVAMFFAWRVDRI